MSWIDTHCHIFMCLNKLGWDVNHYLSQSSAQGVRTCINVATSLQDTYDALKHLQSPNIFCTAGIHPCEISSALEEKSELEIEKELKSLCARPDIYAIGETGLDFFDSTSEEEKKQQIHWFEKQASLAIGYNKPLIIHCRNAFSSCFEILRDWPCSIPRIFHCFTGGIAEATHALSLGYTLSFSGIVTFKNAQKIQEAAKITPLESMLLETDAPFLTPVPRRKETNHSGHIPLIGSYISFLKQISVEELSQATTQNAQRVFGLRHSP